MRNTRKWTALLVCVGALLVGTRSVWAFQHPVGERLPNLDKRQSQAAASTAVPAEKAAAAENLRGVVPGARIDFDGVTGAPKWIGSTSGFLTGPDGQGLAPASLAAVSAQDPHRVTKAFIREHRDLFGHGPEALEGARIKRDYVTAHNGMKTVVWEQQLDDIVVFDSALISHTTRNGELISLSSSFLPDLVTAADAGTPGRAALQAAPAIPAPRAVVLAAASLAESVQEEEVAQTSAAAGAERRQQLRAPGLKGDVDAWLTWLPMNASSLRLCWDVILTSRTRGEMFRILVDVQTGEVLLRRCLTDYLSNASYRVFTSDSPSPMSPGNPTPVTNQPPLVARTLVTLSALDTNASPAGWIDDGGNETRGNNVDAHTDWNADNIPDLPRPQGSPFRVFDFAMDLATQDPTNYSQAAVVQLFYLCNWYHDKMYQLGFTEAAGNFQSNNFARGGLGNDAVQADAQDGSGTDNANFSTPPDGSPGRMQMYIFTGMSPRRDGDFDAEVVLHEHTHGLSWRLVGGGQGLGTTQSDGMGEGWSDFYGLSLLSEAGDNVNGNYAAGAYVSYKIGGASDLQNYYFGIRRYPYTTDMSRNPLTFNDIDPAQADNCSSGAPYHTAMFGTCSGASASEVHNEGEVWCVTLWDARANLINKYGWAVGNQLILQLVTDGMKLTPAAPNFLQARDAIIQADLVDTGGANRNELWAAFAKRGMGFSATSPASTTSSGVHESFDLPDDLRITPAAGFVASGPVGGPFTPASMTLTLTNAGSNSLSWTIVNTSTWLSVSPSGGTLTPAGPGATVTASLNATATSLPMGIYPATVWFTNLNSHLGINRIFTLRVGQPDYFTELFDTSTNDLAFQTFTFVPGASASYYSVCRETAASFPTDPTGGTTVSLTDDSFAQETLSGTNTVAIYSQRASVFFIGSNGYLTMGSGDNSLTASYANHFALPRISALLRDLNPGVGGNVSWKQLADRAAVTYSNVPEYGNSTRTNSFQIEMFFDGRIRVTYLGLRTQDGLAGLSAGTGVPANFTESDFSAYGPCTGPPLLVTVPATATEGDGVLVGAGHVYLPAPVATNLPVALTSSDTTEATVPAAITIPAGRTNATFDITIVNDTVLDGTQSATITASAPGFANGSASLSVFDNETATLSVVLPATATEGQGTVSGTVRVSAVVAADVTVGLTSSDTTEIQVPPTVTIPLGQTSVVFTATVVDDTLIDGPQTAIVTAHVQNWTDGVASITVLDNENLNLVVTLPAFATEGDGVLTNAGRVWISGTLPTNLVVSLASSNVVEAAVPATVVITAGQLFGAFNVTIGHNPAVTGDQTVIIAGSAPGFVTGSTSMIVKDYETPPLPSNPTPSNLASNVAANTSLSWTGGSGNVTNGVYFGTNPTPGPAQLVGSTTSTTWTLPLLAPNTTYYWQIVSRRVGTSTGPVWRFTTRGVDHFVWSSIASPQFRNVPFGVTVTARDEFNTLVSNFTGPVGLSGWSGSSGLSQLVTFDDLSGSDLPVPAGYDGLTWSNFYYLIGTNTPNSGYPAGTVSPPNSVFNGNGTLASIISTGQVNFVSAYLTAAWNDNLQVQAKGYAGASLVYSNSYTLSATAPTLVNFNYLGVTEVDFTSSGGTPHPGYSGSGTHFVIDNVVTGGSAASPVSVTPTNSGNFASGSWTGSITVLQLATNMNLRADDGVGHVGNSTNFTVLAQNDLILSMTAAPNPVTAGQTWTNTIAVTNTGPAAATGVFVTNLFPASATFVSATASQGSFTVASNAVTFNVGVISGGGGASFGVVVAPSLAGTITNLAVVTRAEGDGEPSNNSAITTTLVQMPILSINNVSGLEGNSGFTPFTFSVQLSPASSTIVTVNYATTNGTAQSGSDYIGANGTLTFLAGQTNQTLTVQVVGDTSVEPNETFFVALSSPVNAALGTATGTGTIINDDTSGAGFVNGSFETGDFTGWITNDLTSPFSRLAVHSAGFSAWSSFFSCSPTDGSFAATHGFDGNGPGTIQIAQDVLVPPNATLLSFDYQAAWDLVHYSSNALPRVFQVVVQPAGGGTVLAAYTNLVALGNTINTNTGPITATIDLAAFGGSNVRIGFQAYIPQSSTGPGFFQLDHVQFLGSSLPSLVTNDFCSTAIVITGAAYTNAQSTTGATSTGDPLPSCGSGFGSGVWYRYMPTLNGKLVVDTDGSDFDTILAVYTGACGALNQVACDDDDGDGVTSKVSIQVSAGTTYFILAGGYGGEAGNMVLHLELSPSGTPPVIITQPASQTNAVGGTAFFSVGAAGSLPLSYQWRFNRINNLAGATNATLALTPLALTNAGSYSVVVTNSYGAVTSQVATLTIPSSSTRFAILSGESVSSWDADVRAKILASNPAAQIDVIPVSAGNPAPTLAQLQFYQAVFVYTDSEFTNSVGLGNVLADFVDAGGGVVVATFGFNSSGIGLAGRLVSGGYLPLSLGSQTEGTEYSLVADQPQHPILAGVAAFAGGSSSFHELVTLQPNAVLVAHWSDGQPLVATKQLGGTAGRVTGLNFFPPSQSVRSDFWRTNSAGGLLMANALLWTANQSQMLVAVFDNPLFVDTTSGGVSAESDNVQASLTNLGYSVVTFTNIISGIAGKRVVLIPELENGDLAAALSAAERTALQSLVQGGGTLVIHGSYTTTRTASLINAILGTSVAELTETTGAIYNRTPQAAGTSFAGNPATLAAMNGSDYLATTSLPSGALSIYTNSTHTLVAVLPSGAGRIVFLAWDWYNAAPIGTQDGGWLQVLASAVAFGGSSPQPQAPIITTQPTNQIVAVGGTAAFSVTASGTAPLSYFWRRNGTPIPGATVSSYSTNNLQLADTGSQFSCFVSNAYGTALSSNALLTVIGGGGTVRIVPASSTTVENCIPFGDNADYGFTGFIYRNVPGFSINPGDRLRFDLGAMNDLDVRRNIYIAQANLNPAAGGASQGVQALGWIKIVSDSQIPANPRGNNIVGDYELTYTIEASFSFSGGGLILGFGGSPPGTFADNTCDQVLVGTTAGDASGNFHRRFYYHPDQDPGVLDAGTTPDYTNSIGGFIIETVGGCVLQTNYIASQTFTDGLTSTTMALAFDGTNYWSVSGGTPSGNRLARYDAIGNLLATYAPGMDFRSVFTDAAGNLYARAYGSSTIYQQTAPGAFITHLLLSGGSLDSQSSVVLNGSGTEFIAMNNGVVSRWQTDGTFLGAFSLVGFGSVSGETAYPQNRGVAAAGNYWLTYNGNGILSVWDATGMRVGQATLQGVGTSFDSAFSFSYCSGKVFVVDSGGGPWRGYEFCAQTIPALRFLPPHVNGGNLQLMLGTTDGSPLPPERAARILFYGITNPSLSFSNWTPLTNTTVLSNGLLRVDGLSISNFPRRFFRAVQTP